MASLLEIKNEIKEAANPEKAKILQKFFKTGKGEYGEGDIFVGITVPESRKIAIKFKDLSLENVESLFQSNIHEERLIALLLLVHNYGLAEKGKDEISKDNIYNFYLKSLKYINNWDLVDLSADKIIGPHLINKEKYILYKLSNSQNIWERRIAIISTFHFIKQNKFDETLKIAEILLSDKHDLIHKAVGWMLREIGKKNENVLKKFLNKNYGKMPRTMLRYSIEKFPNDIRMKYLNGEISNG